jgi:hypothetical protein
MFNIQLQRLNRSMMDHLKPDQYCLVFEPLKIGRKKIAKLHTGDFLYMGKKLPSMWIVRGDELVARVRPGRRGGQEGILVQSEVSEQMEKVAPGKKKEILKARMALLREDEIREGEWIDFSWPVSQYVFLYYKEKFLAVSSLVSSDEGYALRITECSGGV